MTHKRQLRLVDMEATDHAPEISSALEQLTKAYDYACKILQLSKGGVGNRSALVPRWDRRNHVLYLGDQIVKQYVGPAPNQQAVLAAFQEEGWPPHIHDAIPPAPEQHHKIRLRDTIKCLNAHQKNQLIRFHGDGTGKGVRWEVIGLGASHIAAPVLRLLRVS